MSTHEFFLGDRSEVILHPTDFSEASHVAFAHALRLAVHNQASLSLLHVHPDESEPIPWHEFPSVRKTLENWGLLEPGSRRSDVTRKLGLRVEKVVGHDANVCDSIVGFLQDRAVDLIIVVTEGAQGFQDALRGSTTQQLVRRAPCPVLAIPFDF